MRSCDRFREAFSARLDGEDPGMPEERIDEHVMACDDCRAWTARVDGLARDLASDHAPPMRAAALADLIRQTSPATARPGWPLGRWRIALAIVAVAQLVLAWPGVFLEDGHAGAHVANELTSWDLGLAVGFLLLAWMPTRAWGALPVVAVMVALLAGTSVNDLLAGRAELAREAVHGLQLAGLGCLWVLARRLPRASVVLRLGAAS